MNYIPGCLTCDASGETQTCETMPPIHLVAGSTLPFFVDISFLPPEMRQLEGDQSERYKPVFFVAKYANELYLPNGWFCEWVTPPDGELATQLRILPNRDETKGKSGLYQYQVRFNNDNGAVAFTGIGDLILCFSMENDEDPPLRPPCRVMPTVLFGGVLLSASQEELVHYNLYQRGVF